MPVPIGAGAGTGAGANPGAGATLSSRRGRPGPSGGYPPADAEGARGAAVAPGRGMPMPRGGYAPGSPGRELGAVSARRRAAGETATVLDDDAEDGAPKGRLRCVWSVEAREEGVVREGKEGELVTCGADTAVAKADDDDDEGRGKGARSIEGKCASVGVELELRVCVPPPEPDPPPHRPESGVSLRPTRGLDGAQGDAPLPWEDDDVAPPNLGACHANGLPRTVAAGDMRSSARPSPDAAPNPNAPPPA